MDYYFATLPLFIKYMLTSLVLMSAFVAVYVLATPHREFELIRSGKTAAAVQLIGVLLGFIAPLASVIIHSVNIPDLILWAVVAAAIQIVTFWIVHLLFRNISARLEEDCLSSGIFIGGLSLGVGILQAACMVP